MARMRSFAIIPAAGRSQRMGQPKLLLPWRNSTVIEHVLAAWRASQVSRVLMVVHPTDHQLAEIGQNGGVLVIQPEIPPSEMKVSVRLALDYLKEQLQPRASDAWLVAPADLPDVRTDTIDRVISAYAASLHGTPLATRIWAPTCAGRRGHPVLFPWPLAEQVERLADDEGINALLSQNPVELVEVESLGDDDLDTPEDYERLRAQDRG